MWRTGSTRWVRKADARATCACGQAGGGPWGRTEGKAKRLILARRARFVTAALASVVTGAEASRRWDRAGAHLRGRQDQLELVRDLRHLGQPAAVPLPTEPLEQQLGQSQPCLDVAATRASPQPCLRSRTTRAILSPTSRCPRPTPAKTSDPWRPLLTRAPVNRPGTRPKVYSIAIEVTAHCQQKCSATATTPGDGQRRRHGSRDAEEAPPARVERVLSRLEVDHVTVTGGEPFARKDVWELLDVVSTIASASRSSSNGLIDDAIAGVSRRTARIMCGDARRPDRRAPRRVGGGHYRRRSPASPLRRAGVTVVRCTVITRKNAARLAGSPVRSLGVRHMALSRFSPAGLRSPITPPDSCRAVTTSPRAFHQASPSRGRRSMRFSCVPFRPASRTDELAAQVRRLRHRLPHLPGVRAPGRTSLGIALCTDLPRRRARVIGRIVTSRAVTSTSARSGVLRRLQPRGARYGGGCSAASGGCSAPANRIRSSGSTWTTTPR